ncbi:probable E3 ubiquitin-protein ligase LUL4 [Abrus precatorius]|uniref:RING-type E3 ubiquitin transferase n=1 Tax=Abrus precatorius TaxID=3816 RepID=A0A8B8LIP5_ABRPR|nr:probable E3 ubiquitin-protein ligase LUL4 [Abrus precatorius]
MGISWSSRRRNNFIQNPPPPPSYYYPPQSHPPPPPPPPPQGYYFPSTTPYTPHCTNYVSPPALPPPPPPPPPQPQTHSFYYSNPNDYTNYANSTVNRLHYHPFYVNQPHPSGWPAIRPSASTPPPYVDHQTAKKIRNYVNVHKDTLRLELDDHNPDHHLLSFVFDAIYDGSITIFYFAKEEEKCRFVPLFPDAFEPIRIPFQKGVGQKFAQPAGTGIDLGFFELDDLSKPSPGEDVFPLVICAETCPSADETPGDSLQDASPHMQITQGVLEKSNSGGPFQIKVVRQILWIDGVRYELRELYGIGSSAATDFDDNDPGKECVICMTEPKDTAVLPCRHMCMCSECAKALRLQSNKCPICRQSIEELIEIKVNNANQ